MSKTMNAARKVFAIVLVFALVLGMNVTAFADNTTTSEKWHDGDTYYMNVGDTLILTRDQSANNDELYLYSGEGVISYEFSQAERNALTVTAIKEGTAVIYRARNGWDKYVTIVVGTDAGTGHTSKGCFDHIDIASAMTATVSIDGTNKNASFTIAKADAANILVTAAYGDGTAVSFTRSGVSTSTGSSGEGQIRLTGSFPAGTKADPVYYTVTLTKNITVGGVSVPVTLSTTIDYWSVNNTCPGVVGSNTWANGGMTSNGGIDLALSNGSGSTTTYGSIQIQKTLSGAALTAEKTFTFTVKKADGSVYDTESITVPAGSATASTILTQVPFGAYTVTEDTTGADIDGYTFNGVTGETQVTVSAAANSPHVNITNSYTEIPVAEPTYAISVTKSFSATADGEAVAIPQAYSVTFKLYAAADTDTVLQTLTVSASDFTDGAAVKAFAAAVENGSYVVTETVSNAPQGTATETGSQNVTVNGAAAAATFANSYAYTTPTGSLTVTKTVSGLPELTGAYTVDVTVNGETKTLTIAAGSVSGSVTFTGLPVGQHAVAESNITGVPEFYNLVAASSTVTATATVAAGETAGANLVNAYARDAFTVVPGSITISKAIGADNQLEGAADRTYSFTVSGPTGYANTVSVKGNASVTITDLQAGVYTVTENDASVDHYSLTATGAQTVTLTQGETDAQNRQTVSSESVSFTNSYKYVPQNTDNGTLTVTKSYSGEALEGLPENFQIDITRGGAAVATLTLKDAAMTGTGTAADPYTWTINNLAAGAYTATEKNYAVGSYTLTNSSVTTGSATLAVVAAANGDTSVGTGSIALSNSYEKTMGSDVPGSVTLTVNKVDADNVLITGGTATFTLTDESGNVTTASTTNGVASFTFGNGALPAGTYTLAESAAPAGYEPTAETWTVKVSSDYEIKLSSDKSVWQKVWSWIIGNGSDGSYADNTIAVRNTLKKYDVTINLNTLDLGAAGTVNNSSVTKSITLAEADSFVKGTLKTVFTAASFFDRNGSSTRYDLNKPSWAGLYANGYEYGLESSGTAKTGLTADGLKAELETSGSATLNYNFVQIVHYSVDNGYDSRSGLVDENNIFTTNTAAGVTVYKTLTDAAGLYTFTGWKLNGSDYAVENDLSALVNGFSQANVEKVARETDSGLTKLWFRFVSDWNADTDGNTGAISITKNVLNSAAVMRSAANALEAANVLEAANGLDYTFTITGKDVYGAEVSRTVTVKGNSSVSVALTNGVYSVAEDTGKIPAIEGYSFNYGFVTDGESVTVNGDRTELTCDNFYSRDTGALRIVKTYSGIANLPADLSFTVTGPDFETTLSYSEFGEDGSYILYVPTGLYTVTESGAQVSPYTLTTTVAYTGENGTNVTRSEYNSGSPEAGDLPTIGINNVYTLPYVPPVVTTYTLTVKHVTEDGAELRTPAVTTLNSGDAYATSQETFEGYTFSAMATGSDPASGTMTKNMAVTYVYTKNVELPDENIGDGDGPTGDTPDLPDEDLGGDDQQPTGDVPEEEFSEEQPTDAAPNTGDNSNLAVVWTLLILCGGCVAFIARGLRRRED